MRSSRRTTIGVLAALAMTSLTLVLPSGPSAADTPADDLGAVDLTKKVSRVHRVDGQDVVAETRTVTLSVNQTKDLRSRQPVTVRWSGAHPTSAVVGDQSSPRAAQQEYPFVLLQCRGVDSPSAPAAEQLRPQTCWTQSPREERWQFDASTGFPPWRVDRFAAPQDRRQHVGDPDPFPADCTPQTYYTTRRLAFVDVAGTTFYPDPSACMPMPPEARNVDLADQPGNTTYGLTLPDGTGSAKFTMWTKEDNTSLGCSATVACALVAVPIIGISCDSAATDLPTADRPPARVAATVDQTCRADNDYAVGAPLSSAPTDPAVRGELWSSESNWRNRITVPLTFAPPSSICDIAGGKAGVDLYGSELMAQATTQWRPVFCTDPQRTPFRHVQVGEPQARNLLTQGTIDAALLSTPPADGYGRPVVNAPVAFTGFAISYAVDDKDGKEYGRLRLTPRLLAKLMTMSYPAETFVQQEYQALSKNPLDMSRDKEFQALNPGIRDGVNAAESASTLLSLSSDSDVIHALTSYIGADPEARAWLDGKPDPWGMVVNPSYRGLALPVESWPLLDTFEPTKYYATKLNLCLADNPVPFLPQVAAPVSRLFQTSFALQFAISNSQVICPVLIAGQTEGLKLVALGREAPGYRFVLGVTSLGDAERYQLRTAALRTQVGAAASPSFSTAAGPNFVAPTGASLRAAAALLAPDETSGSWPVPYARISTDAEAAGAYPGALVVYAAVPTTGLTKDDATAYAAMLKWSVTSGQAPGPANGQLAAGFLPMTTANSLGALAAYTLTAADAVAAQQGQLPRLVPVQAKKPAVKPPTPSPSARATQAGAVAPEQAGPSAPPVPAPAATGAVTPTVAVPGPAPARRTKPVAAAAPASRFLTTSRDVGLAGLLVPAMLGLALVSGSAVSLRRAVRAVRARR